MLFVSDAMAAGEAAAAGGMEGFLVQVVPLIVIFAVFWFFLIRPQQKRQKEHAKMCEGLTKGDEVMTMGGISGRIEGVDDQSISLQVAHAARCGADGSPQGIHQVLIERFIRNRGPWQMLPGLFFRKRHKRMRTAL